MRICLVYDCLFPYTIGGGERWYRALGERLAADGHDVTSRFPELRPLGETLGSRPAVLDGQIVALDPEGRPSSEVLAPRLRHQGPKAPPRGRQAW